VAKHFDLVRQNVASAPGTGSTIPLGGAVAGWLTFALAGVANGDVVTYAIIDAVASEIGTATYSTTGPSLTGRTPLKSTNSNAAINATISAVIICTLAAEDLGSAAALNAGTAANNAVQLDANGLIPGSLVTPHCGYLSFVSATQIKFAPEEGDLVKIAGVLYRIPSGGITAANTSVFVNGTGGSSLAASTTYYASIFKNAGTLTFDFISFATGRATDTTAGNTGVSIKSGDNTRSIIGMVTTTASSQFVDNNTGTIGVISFFNRRLKTTKLGVAGTPNTTSTTFVLATSPVSYLTWGDEAAVPGFATGVWAGTTQFDQAWVALGIDGVAPSNTTAPTVAAETPVSGANIVCAGGVHQPMVQTEGLHTAALYVRCSTTQANMDAARTYIFATVRG
jgi:hypothetical protein